MDIESAQASVVSQTIAKVIEELSSAPAEDNEKSASWWANYNCSKYCEASGYPHSSISEEGKCSCSGVRLWLPLPRR